MFNTALIPSLTITEAANLAHWQANQALRAGRVAKAATDARRREAFEYERDVHINKMYDILEASRYPTLTTEDVVRRLGRSKAMVVKIERRIINLALCSTDQ
jgi:hypothetical protein